MKLVLFNTCGAEASVALADTERAQSVIAVATMPGRTASENLVAELRRTMVEAQWRLSDLEGIVVVTGPGSFTGVRVGLSAAKGLGEALGTPMFAVSRLAMLAAAAGQVPGRVCALLDAGRGQFYCGQYDNSVEVSETLVSKEEAIRASLRAERSVACEGTVVDALRGSVMVTMVEEPGAADTLPFAIKKIAAGIFDDAVKLDASYLRRTDAEIFAKRAD